MLVLNSKTELSRPFKNGRVKWNKFSWHRVTRKEHGVNRPFYSCVLSYLAFECKRGWSWPCFDTDLSGFSFKCQLVSIRTAWFTQQKQWGLYQNKVTSSLTAIQRPGHWADNCKMVYSMQDLKCSLPYANICIGSREKMENVKNV